MAASAPASYPPPPHTRSRQSSSASQRYVPENYYASSEQAPPPPAQGYPYAYGKPAPPAAMSTINQRGSYGPPPGQSVPPENLLHPVHAAYPSSMAPGNPPYPYSDADAGFQQQASADMAGPRRQSYSPTHSRRSHDRRRSRDSHRSHKSHHSRRSSDEDYDRERRHRHRDDKERRHKHERDYERPIKRADTHKPTLGDTLFAMWDGVKNALGPRDKY
ncbi:hypothetical protein LTR85_002388 [Meristemomyces frigidus]|nr:hypothetical protein LTR85_002388 [Meristemomyces frigidus]